MKGYTLQFQDMNIPSELGAEFLETFTRLEYALKASGQFAIGGDNGVSAWWDGFANAVDDRFRAITDHTIQEAVNFLLTEPARKQVLTGFSEIAIDPKQTRALNTLLVIRTVRNNIVHGGKIQPEGEHERGRNVRLIAASLKVLKRAAELEAIVAVHFRGGPG
jgi:hypothetical protein